MSSNQMNDKMGGFSTTSNGTFGFGQANTFSNPFVVSFLFLLIWLMIKSVTFVNIRCRHRQEQLTLIIHFYNWDLRKKLNEITLKNVHPNQKEEKEKKYYLYAYRNYVIFIKILYSWMKFYENYDCIVYVKKA